MLSKRDPHPHPNDPQIQRLRSKNPRREEPPKRIARPPQRVDNLGPVPTYVADGRVRQLAVPFILDLSDLAVLDENVDRAVHQLLHADAFHFVEVAQVEGNGVAGAGDEVGFALDFAEGGLEAVLLCAVKSAVVDW